MNKERATKRQQELLQFVDDFIKEHGYGPSYREIMRSIGYKSVSTVAVHVEGLIAKGYLERKDNSPRSLEVVGRERAKPKSAIVTAIEAKLADENLAEEDKTALERVRQIFEADL